MYVWVCVCALVVVVVAIHVTSSFCGLVSVYECIDTHTQTMKDTQRNHITYKNLPTHLRTCILRAIHVRHAHVAQVFKKFVRLGGWFGRSGGSIQVGTAWFCLLMEFQKITIVFIKIKLWLECDYKLVQELLLLLLLSTTCTQTCTHTHTHQYIKRYKRQRSVLVSLAIERFILFTWGPYWSIKFMKPHSQAHTHTYIQCTEPCRHTDILWF